MPFAAPLPADDPPPEPLRQLLARAQAEWTTEHTTLPPRPPLCPTGDRWLPQAFPALVLELADRLGADVRDHAGLVRAFERARLETGRAAATASFMAANTNVQASRTVGSRGVLTRTQACPFIRAYLTPLLDPTAYRRWLDDMALTQVFWRGGNEQSPWVPRDVARREGVRDQELIDRWVGVPPQAPQDTATKSEKRRHQLALDEYQRRRARVQAFVQSEPAAPGLALPFEPTRKEARGLEERRRTAARDAYPIVAVPQGAPQSANLFISEAARQIGPYLELLGVALAPAAGELDLRGSLTGVAYGFLALAQVPLFCLYDNFHGTCAIEEILPRANASAEVMRTYGGAPLRQALTPLLRQRVDPPDERILSHLLEAFASFGSHLAAATVQAHLALAKTAADLSGGRVRTPSRFSPQGTWQFDIAETAPDGSTVTETRVAGEALAYDADRDSAANREIFWLLRNLWAPLGTAVALTNQAGMRFYINAANNRWNGRHPPHKTHREGASVDFDIGLSWREGKVPNVKVRDNFGRPVDEREVPGNRSNPDCLHGINRLAGWIGVQAFVLVGVRYYLYGDRSLVNEASRHLAAYFQVERPALMDGRIDAAGHADHWHFELLVGMRPAGQDPYVWQTDDPSLLDRLHELAVERDEDAGFWKRIAGFDSVPTTEADFDAADVPDAEDWKAWWMRRDGPAGISLLPVWAPALAAETLGWDKCGDAREFPPPVLEPGEAAG